MDDIANAIKDRCSFQVRLRGVNVYSCRIVDFEFQKTEVQEEVSDTVKREQIKTWRADWQREAEQTRAEGNAEADLLKQEARAYAYTNLLTAVAEGLQEARHLDPKLPQYVIAVKFISALEKLIEEQPETQDITEARASLNGVKKLIPWTTKHE
jgi:regulator of protease activity HflC (stomatin/prohibitin superfamily)